MYVKFKENGMWGTMHFDSDATIGIWPCIQFHSFINHLLFVSRWRRSVCTLGPTMCYKTCDQFVVVRHLEAVLEANEQLKQAKVR